MVRLLYFLIDYLTPIIPLFLSLGTPFRRYHSYTEPYNLEQDIKYLLDEADEPSKEGSAIDYHENRRKPKDFLLGETMEQEDMD